MKRVLPLDVSAGGHPLSTYAKFSEKLTFLEVVFDVSIKNVERDRRSSGNQLLFKTIVSSAVIKQWPVSLL